MGVVPFALVLGRWRCSCCWSRTFPARVLILGIGAVLMFVGGTGLQWFVLAGAGGAAAIGAAIMRCRSWCPTRPDRLSSWLDPFADPLGDGHQTIQSLYAIGSGGAAGWGWATAARSICSCPNRRTTSSFRSCARSLALSGRRCAVILLFALLLGGASRWRAHAPDRFGALLVVGFVVQVALQAVLNMAVVTNTIPNTGISLPFFSSGGTS